MNTRLLAQIAVIAGISWFACGAASAKTVTVTGGDVPITVEIPDAWQVTEIDRGVQAKTADEEVYLWFESYAPADYDKVMGEHEAYFAKQGVTISGKARSKTGEEPGYFVKATEFPAEYDNGPTVLRYISVEPKNQLKKRILMSYWASPEGDKEHSDEMKKIVDSLGKSVDAEK